MVMVQKLTLVAYALHDGKRICSLREECKRIIILSLSLKVKRGKRVPWTLIRNFRRSHLPRLSSSTSAMSSTSTPCWLVPAAPSTSSWHSWTAQTFNQKKLTLQLRWLGLLYQSGIVINPIIIILPLTMYLGQGLQQRAISSGKYCKYFIIYWWWGFFYMQYSVVTKFIYSMISLALFVFLCSNVTHEDCLRESAVALNTSNIEHFSLSWCKFRAWYSISLAPLLYHFGLLQNTDSFLFHLDNSRQHQQSGWLRV